MSASVACPAAPPHSASGASSGSRNADWPADMRDSSVLSVVEIVAIGLQYQSKPTQSTPDGTTMVDVTAGPASTIMTLVVGKVALMVWAAVWSSVLVAPWNWGSSSR